jgi:predicted Fe-S protein YdhL (DUF1289 family)
MKPAPADAVKSPCISVCQMDPRSGLCEGCLRTLDEIAGWISFSDDEKREVLSRLRERRAHSAQPARGIRIR